MEDIPIMIALLFILIITGLSVLLSSFLSPDPNWFDYYKGGIIGFFFSGVILHILNEIRRRKELKKEKIVGERKKNP
jgi:hypothetical protein